MSQDIKARDRALEEIKKKAEALRLKVTPKLTNALVAPLLRIFDVVDYLHLGSHGVNERNYRLYLAESLGSLHKHRHLLEGHQDLLGELDEIIDLIDNHLRRTPRKKSE